MLSRCIYLQAEVIEVQVKPSKPIGEIGQDTFETFLSLKIEALGKEPFWQ